MVRQVIVAVAIVALLCACGTVTHAATYEVYNGSPSNTYIQYFRDILPSLSILDNYLVIRSGQYEYRMIVGDIVYNNGLFTSDSQCDVYVFSQADSGYNGYYTYHTEIIDSLVVDVDNKIVYSDLGNYPQLEERGAKFEILTAITICAIIVGFVCRSIFRYRPR